MGIESRPETTDANIGPRQRLRRLRLGIAAFIFGAAVSLLLISIDSPLWVRVGVFPLFYAGALGWLQAREKT